VTRQDITGVILAGGEGRRLGGVDKGLQELRGRPMVQWVLERLAPQVDTVLISANRNLQRYAAFGCPVLPDRIPDFAGPLAGLHAALTQAATPLVATVPCDSPFLPADLVARLHAALMADQAELAVARAGTGPSTGAGTDAGNRTRAQSPRRVRWIISTISPLP
jgi:molybdopterin-guanine dinucleotide biosynthesis protein A